MTTDDKQLLDEKRLRAEIRKIRAEARHLELENHFRSGWKRIAITAGTIIGSVLASAFGIYEFYKNFAKDQIEYLSFQRDELQTDVSQHKELIENLGKDKASLEATLKQLSGKLSARELELTSVERQLESANTRLRTADRARQAITAELVAARAEYGTAASRGIPPVSAAPYLNAKRISLLGIRAERVKLLVDVLSPYGGGTRGMRLATELSEIPTMGLARAFDLPTTETILCAIYLSGDRQVLITDASVYVARPGFPIRKKSLWTFATEEYSVGDYGDWAFASGFNLPIGSGEGRSDPEMFDQIRKAVRARHDLWER